MSRNVDSVYRLKAVIANVGIYTTWCWLVICISARDSFVYLQNVQLLLDELYSLPEQREESELGGFHDMSLFEGPLISFSLS